MFYWTEEEAVSSCFMFPTALVFAVLVHKGLYFEAFQSSPEIKNTPGLKTPLCFIFNIYDLLLLFYLVSKIPSDRQTDRQSFRSTHMFIITLDHLYI